MLGFFNEIKKFNTFKRSKKSVTLAGALVFFAVFSIVPTAYLLSLAFSLFGKELSSIASLFNIKEFEEVKSFLLDATTKLSASGNAVVLFTMIYSSANLFVHLKLTGEFIYNYKPIKALKLRVFSILVTIILSLFLAVLLVIYAYLSVKIKLFLGNIIGGVLNIAFLFFIVFASVIILNLYACPYKIKAKEVLFGSIYTSVFFVLSSVIFIVYINYFKGFSRAYLNLSTVIVFLGWLFVIMRCLVSGFIINAYQIGRLKTRKNLDLKL
ncbi:MAG: YihY/virulence factor BrkB family protein [Clostridia bacterium]|nr:YihY/virulence factor BrkB family protein [Clostridia bacterium]